MSEKPIESILKNIGLTKRETEVYIFLAKYSALKSIEIAKKTRIDTAEVYRILKSLQTKGIIEATLESPARYVIVPFERLIDSFIKARQDEVALVQKAKDSLLFDWKRISTKNLEPSPEKFVVIEGESKIYLRFLQLVKDTKNQLSIVSTVQELVEANRFGVFDPIALRSLGSKVQFQFITQLSKENISILKALLKKINPTGFNIKGRSPDLGLRLSTRMVIRDEEEILLFITAEKETSTRKAVCLWTDCKTIVQSFTGVFESLWKNSTEIEKRILDLEAGEPTPQRTIWDPKIIKKNYNEIFSNAQEELIFLTSSEGLKELCKKTFTLKRLAKKGVSIKVMAPIARENLRTYELLSSFCKIRHFSESRLNTTLIDGQHLFQFSNTALQAVKRQATFTETAIYTNNREQVQKTRAILFGIWEKARHVIGNTSDSIAIDHAIGSFTDSLEVDKSVYRKMLAIHKDRVEGTVKEKDIIKKIVQAKRMPAKDPAKDINTLYGSQAIAVLHLPSDFKLPDMIIKIWHNDKNSTFGAEDALDIYLWLETPNGYAFVPVAHVTDNPKAIEYRKGVYAKTPAGQNIILVRRNQLKVIVHGDTLFAGWTTPIPLIPPKYILPPASMLFEAFGELKTGIGRTSLPSGRTQVHEFNRFGAFVTFFHPSSKYSGPGTEGWFDRECIMTAYPPPNH